MKSIIICWSVLMVYHSVLCQEFVVHFSDQNRPAKSCLSHANQLKGADVTPRDFTSKQPFSGQIGCTSYKNSIQCFNHGAIDEHINYEMRHSYLDQDQNLTIESYYCRHNPCSWSFRGEFSSNITHFISLYQEMSYFDYIHIGTYNFSGIDILSFPIVVKNITVNSTTAELRLKHNAEVVKHHLEHLMEFRIILRCSDPDSQPLQMSTQKTRIIFDNLCSDMEYAVQVESTNIKVPSFLTALHSFRTYFYTDPNVPETPQLIGFEIISSDYPQIKVHWIPLQLNERNGPNLAYSIKFDNSSGGQSTIANISDQASNQIISSFPHSNDFRIWLFASNSVGQSGSTELLVNYLRERNSLVASIATVNHGDGNYSIVLDHPTRLSHYSLVFCRRFQPSLSRPEECRVSKSDLLGHSPVRFIADPNHKLWKFGVISTINQRVIWSKCQVKSIHDVIMKVNVEKLSEETVLLKWEPQCPTVKLFIKYFIIEYCESEENIGCVSDPVTIKLSTDLKSFLIKNLKAETFYQFRLKGRSSKTDSSNELLAFVSLWTSERNKLWIKYLEIIGFIIFIITTILITIYLIAIKKRNLKIKKKTISKAWSTIQMPSNLTPGMLITNQLDERDKTVDSVGGTCSQKILSPYNSMYCLMEPEAPLCPSKLPIGSGYRNLDSVENAYVTEDGEAVVKAYENISSGFASFLFGDSYDDNIFPMDSIDCDCDSKNNCNPQSEIPFKTGCDIGVEDDNNYKRWSEELQYSELKDNQK